MAGDDVANLVVKVDSKGVVDATKNLDNLNKESKETVKESSKLKSAFSGVKTAVIGLSAALFAAGAAMVALVTTQATAAREAIAYSRALGVPIEKLTALGEASKSVGIQSDKMFDILKDVSEKIADAFANKGGEAVEVMQRLGINLEQIAKVSPDRQLLMVADALGRLNTQGERVQVMEALASDSSLLLPLLENNAAGLRELTQAAIDSGAALTSIEADKLEKADRAILDFKQSISNLAQNIAIEVADPISKVIKQLAVGIPNALKIVNDVFTNLKLDVVRGQIEGTGATLNKLLTEQIELEQKHGDIIKNGGAFKLASYESLKVKIKETQEELTRLKTEELGLLDSGKGPKLDINAGGEENEEKPKLTDAQLALQEKSIAIAESLLNEEDLENLSYARRLEAAHMARQNDAIGVLDHKTLIEGIERNHEKKLTDIENRKNKKKLAMEKSVSDQINQMKQRNFGLAVGLLQQLGGESKKAAYASLALQKGLAIASVQSDAAKATMSAKAVSATMGPAGAVWFATESAAIATQAGISTGLILASAIGEASSIGGGGGSVNSSVSPTTGLPLPDPTLGGINEGGAPNQQEFGRQITVIVEGNVFDSDDFRSSIVNAIETAESNDEIRILNAN